MQKNVFAYFTAFLNIIFAFYNFQKMSKFQSHNIGFYDWHKIIVFQGPGFLGSDARAYGQVQVLEAANKTRCKV